MISSQLYTDEDGCSFIRFDSPEPPAPGGPDAAPFEAYGAMRRAEDLQLSLYAAGCINALTPSYAKAAEAKELVVALFIANRAVTPRSILLKLEWAFTVGLIPADEKGDLQGHAFYSVVEDLRELSAAA